MLLGSDDVGVSSPHSPSPLYPPPSNQPLLPSNHPFLSVSTPAVAAPPSVRLPTSGADGRPSTEVKGPLTVAASPTPRPPDCHGGLSCVGSGLSKLQLVSE